MTEAFSFCDEMGPEKVVLLYDPSTKLRAIVVVDNVATGPAIGGLRMAVDVTTEECFRLARAMTLKNAAAGLPHGGGKSVLIADPNMQTDAKERLVRSFAYATKDINDYIVGPDMGTNETAMAWIKDVAGRAVGLPRELGGIPLDEIGATGYGVCAALEVAEKFHDFSLDGGRVAIQGFGSVGKFAARFLAEKGCLLTAVSDSAGGRWRREGFDVDELVACKDSGRSVREFDQGEPISGDEMVDIDCDIWIPAARPDVLRADNVARLRAKVVAQGANIPATPEAERALASRGVLVLPDFIVNAGGVICAAVEYAGGTQTQAMVSIREKIQANTEELLTRMAGQRDMPRTVALAMATEKVLAAMSYRKTH